jgi:hypothetical protein
MKKYVYCWGCGIKLPQHKLYATTREYYCFICKRKIKGVDYG